MLRITAFIASLLVLTGCVASNPSMGNRMYNNGDHAQAIRYWNKSQSHPDSQYGLGLAWLNGLSNTPVNKNEASVWFLRAAKQGHLAAMNNLGVLQIEGGYKEAGHSWLRLAARNGLSMAIQNLKKYGYEVPEPDLYHQKLKNQKAAEEKNRQDAELLATMFAGFVAGYTQGYPSFKSSTYNVPPLPQNRGSTSRSGSMSAYNCGVKPIPSPGYVIGDCINGQWQMVSQNGMSEYNCGIKPIPRAGYAIGDCVNGKWQIVSQKGMSDYNCGVKPVPPVGYSVGPCINGRWQMVSD